MPDSTVSIPSDLRRDLTIRTIKTTIVDVPTVRKHKLSSLSVTAQSYVIVELRLANGVIGIGEAATLGGPRWSEESVESIKATIDTYLAPALIGSAADRFDAARARMDEAAKRNNAAKVSDRKRSVRCRRQDTRTSLPCNFWAAWCATAYRCCGPSRPAIPSRKSRRRKRRSPPRLHNTFKVKIGAQAPEADMARMRRLASALEGRATLIVDANQAWDETTALRCLPVLAEIGVALVEQPLPAWELLRHGAPARPVLGAVDGR